MKRVSFGYGCRALGYTTGEIFVDDDASSLDIIKQIEDIAEFSIDFEVEEECEVI